MVPEDVSIAKAAAPLTEGAANRLGKAGGITATAHKLARILYATIATKKPCDEQIAFKVTPVQYARRIRRLATPSPNPRVYPHSKSTTYASVIQEALRLWMPSLLPSGSRIIAALQPGSSNGSCANATCGV